MILLVKGRLLPLSGLIKLYRLIKLLYISCKFACIYFIWAKNTIIIPTVIQLYVPFNSFQEFFEGVVSLPHIKSMVT
jgi:hypothetical protein